jgi:hypothetical protein
MPGASGWRDQRQVRFAMECCCFLTEINEATEARGNQSHEQSTQKGKA